MRIYDLIFKKREGQPLNQEEIAFFVNSFTKGEIPDYQASAFLMAAFIRGLNGKETSLLTQAMCESGTKLNLSGIPGIKVDKHSTGGVGDGISLVVAPLVAACGVLVPMISGRGLAHTGGTLDKLESIPGFRTNLTQAEFLSQMERIGVAMIGQTSEIAPADKKIYALRDVTATVDSIPLIAASILSKKLAEGCDALVLDVKTGCGAFMREKKDAVRLAQVMADICKRSRKKVVVLVTRMEEPLGNAIGNGLEVWQAIEILRGEEKRGTESFIELTDVLGGWMLFFGGKVRNSKEGRAKISEVRKSGAGLKKFEEIVRSQGGDPEVIQDPKKFFFRAPIVKEVTSPWKGSVSFINARSVGVAALLLGAGRENQDSVLDPSAGILLAKKLGDRVERGEPIAQFFYSPGARFDEAEKVFLAGVKVGKLRPKPHPLIHQVIR